MSFISFKEEFVSPVSPSRFFKAAIFDATKVFPMLSPELLESAAIVKGDGGPGSVKQYNFTKLYRFSYMQEKHYIIDQENFLNKYNWVEGGDLGTKLKSYEAFVQFVPTSDGGCICKFGVEYETLPGVDYLEEMKDERDNIQLSRATSLLTLRPMLNLGSTMF